MAATKAAAASALSDAYSDVAIAVAAAESLERRYHLAHERTSVESDYDQEVVALGSAIQQVRLLGGSSDRSLVDQAVADEEALTRGTKEVFRAVDRGDERVAERIDRVEIHPAREALETEVSGAAEVAHARSQTELDQLLSRQRQIRFCSHPSATSLRAESGSSTAEWTALGRPVVSLATCIGRPSGRPRSRSSGSASCNAAKASAVSTTRVGPTAARIRSRSTTMRFGWSGTGSTPPLSSPTTVSRYVVELGWSSATPVTALEVNGLAWLEDGCAQVNQVF